MLKQWQIDAWKALDGWDDINIAHPSEVANQKKQQLLEMARNGLSLPTYKTSLGRALYSYTYVKSQCYDLDFDKEIRSLRSDWFVNTVDENKCQLLEMAKNREPKPIYSANKNKRHPLAQSLMDYTSPKRSSYDSEFDKEIRALRPDWFITQHHICKQKKQQLLDMARNGEPKPLQSRKNKHTLSGVLGAYTSKNRKHYDPEFDKEIRTLRPDWFIGQSDLANERKNQLLQMAKNGDSKPFPEVHPLGDALKRYILESSKVYDAEFDKKIRALRPDWFLSEFEIKKQYLLSIAKSGETLNKNDCLRSFLFNACNHKHKCYDPEFEKQIRDLRPDWFNKPKKQQLLEMARNGKPKPNVKSHPLGMTFYCYCCNRKNKCYDPELEKQIRDLRPDWFKKLDSLQKRKRLRNA